MLATLNMAVLEPHIANKVQTTMNGDWDIQVQLRLDYYAVVSN